MAMTLPGRYARLTTRPKTLLMHYLAGGTLTPRVGPALSITRATFGGASGQSNGRLVNVPYGQPQFAAADLDGDGYAEATGLMSEQQRTNVLLYSEDMSNAAWTKTNVTVTANAVRAPDGQLTADKLVETAVTNLHHVSQGTGALTDSLNQAASIYARAAERTWLWIRLLRKDGTTVYAWYDLANGVTGTVGSGAQARIERLADGWCRCLFTANALTGGTSPVVAYGIADADGSNNYAGDTTKGLYVWGAQFEVDRAFPSSYLATTSASVTRNHDLVSFTPTWPLQDMTFYARMARAWWMDTGLDLGGSFHHPFVWHVAQSNGAYVRGYFGYYSGTPRSFWVQISADAGPATTQSMGTPSGAVIEVCVQFVNLLSAPVMRIDMGGGFGAYSTPYAVAFNPESTWSASCHLGGDAAVQDRRLHTPLYEFKIAAGALTLNEMRGAS